MLTEEQEDCLVWLAVRDGSGLLDRYGRVVANGDIRARGSWVAWLSLVSQGLVHGGDRCIRLTSNGREKATELRRIVRPGSETPVATRSGSETPNP